MAILSPVLQPVSQMQLDSGSVVTIPQISWSEFESILQDLGEKRISRIAYSQNTLEIRVPLPEHEKPKDLISDMVKILLKHSGRNIRAESMSLLVPPLLNKKMLRVLNLMLVFIFNIINK